MTYATSSNRNSHYISADLVQWHLRYLRNGLSILAESTLEAVGERRQPAALALANHPHCFLATVQIAMTGTAILTGVFSGATVSDTLAGYLGDIPGLKPYASAIAFGAVVMLQKFHQTFPAEELEWREESFRHRQFLCHYPRCIT